MSQTNHYSQTAIFHLFILLFCSLLVVGSSCKKDKTGIDALPPATQEGKNTFGCMINGKAFLPGKKTWSPSVESLSFSSGYYDGKYSYQISAPNSKADPLMHIIIEYLGPPFEEGTFPLYKREDQNMFTAEYFTIKERGIVSNYAIAPPLTGQITLTKVDRVNGIVSGTFWFDAINNQGEKVEIREGRFDSKIEF